MAEIIEDCTEHKALHQFAETAYLDYAMYVILDRALPHIGDGLKPVQRRIVYAMSELRLDYLAKYKKSARTVGDVLGKFHPHGETACYEAMVLMAQSFSYRYPLIEGQGNFGTADDPKSFAAMRYTEAKLSKHADLLLKELDAGAVNWQENFDGSLKEPKVLPAQLPTVLLNGTTGIAVGMATDIVPHNLTEIANACVYILEHAKPKTITIEEICGYIAGPDFPTAADIITTKTELLEVYKTGYGSVKARAVYSVEKDNIIITALPYMVSGAKVLKQIADQIHSKNLQVVTDLRDESDHENPTRLVIVLKSNRVNAEAVMEHLFATTELEKSYRVNFNMIGIDGRPQVKNLLVILQEWLEFRIDFVKKRLEHRLTKINDRLHILAGLLIAYLNLDEIINIIRYEDDPKAILIKNFKLTETQANAILELKLKNLAKLEEIKINQESEQLTIEQKNIIAILGSKAKLNKLIKQEIQGIIKNYKDTRRSNFVTVTKSTVDLNKELKINKPNAEQVTVVLSDKGWVRCGKGADIDPLNLNYKSGEQYKAHATGRANQEAIFMDSSGKSYSLLVSQLPSMRGYGEPLTSKLAPESGVLFEAIIMGEDKEQLLIASSSGYGFITNINNLKAKNKTGKNIINLAGGKLIPAIKINQEQQYCIAIASDLKLLIFDVKLIPELNKGKGKKLLNINKQNKLVFIAGLNISKDNYHSQLIIKIKASNRAKIVEVIIDFKQLRSYLGNISDAPKKIANLPKLINPEIVSIDIIVASKK